MDVNHSHRFLSDPYVRTRTRRGRGDPWLRRRYRTTRESLVEGRPLRTSTPASCPGTRPRRRVEDVPFPHDTGPLPRLVGPGPPLSPVVRGPRPHGLGEHVSSLPVRVQRPGPRPVTRSVRSTSGHSGTRRTGPHDPCMAGRRPIRGNKDGGV